MDSLESTKNHAVSQDLLPALIQCFGIIFIGYIFGKFQILSNQGKKGLCIFVQYLALPALVFTSVATISFESVKWTFIASVFVAKSVIFIVVALVSMILIKPVHVGKAGLYAIAATQSNDFAMGYPLFVSLYQKNHSTYPSLLYLIAPIQLLVLNLAGFFMLEINKQTTENSSTHQRPLISIIKGIFTNPIVVMTILGIIWNLAFNHTVPLPIVQMLNAVSSAFPATALFLLGHNMAGKISTFRGYFVLTPTLLVLAKIFILPLLLQKIVVMLARGMNTQEMQDLSSLGFLYGTIPCAPSVFVFACQYNLCVDIITSTIIFSTLCSAPIMLVSATMASLSKHGFENIALYMESTIGYISSINLVCCLWLLTMFVMGKRWYNVSYGATVYLILAQLIASVGGVLCFFRNRGSEAILYAQYMMASGGILSTRMWTVFLAILLFVSQWRSLCFILRARHFINIIGFIASFGIAFILAGSLLSNQIPTATASPNFQLGYPQVLVTTIITLLCLLMTTLSLIFHHRYRRINSLHCDGGLEVTDDTSSTVKTEHEQNVVNDYNCFESHSDDKIFHCRINGECSMSRNNVSDKSHNRPVDIEDIGNDYMVQAALSIHSDAPISQTFCDSNFTCSPEQRRLCEHNVEQYQTHEMNSEENGRILRHLVLLIILSFSMLVTFAVCLWKLFLEAASGIFVELEFLDIALNYGQGIIYFLIFGLDTTLIRPFIKMWKFVCRQNMCSVRNSLCTNT